VRTNTNNPLAPMTDAIAVARIFDPAIRVEGAAP
jgi:hypothetical protein